MFRKIIAILSTVLLSCLVQWNMESKAIADPIVALEATSQHNYQTYLYGTVEVPSWVSATMIRVQVYDDAISSHLDEEANSNGGVLNTVISLQPGNNFHTFHYTLRDGTAGEKTLNVIRLSPLPRQCPTINPQTHKITNFGGEVNPEPAGGITYHRVNWSNCDVTNVLFPQTDLTVNGNTGTNDLFYASDFSGTNFSGSTFDATGHPWRLSGRMDHANFSNAHLLSVELGSDDMDYANFTGARLENVMFTAGGFGFSGINPSTNEVVCTSKHLNFTDAVITVGIKFYCDLNGTDASGVASQTGAAQIHGPAANVNFSGWDFSHTTYDSYFFAYDVTNSIFRYCNFDSTDITLGIAPWDGSQSFSQTSRHADFTGSTFRNSHIWDTFGDANLSKTDFTGTNLTNINFGVANLSGANLRSTNLSGVQLGSANLDYVRSGNIQGSHISLPNSWKLLNGYLVGPKADLNYASFYDEDLSGQNLAGAKLNFFDGSGANFSGANLAGASMNYSNFVDANLTNADLHDSHFDYADMHRANMSGAIMTGAFMYGSNLTDAVFSSSSPAQGSIASVPINAPRRTDLRNSNFTNADLKNANFNRADIRGANFFNSNLSGATFDGVTWGQTTCQNGSTSNAHLAGSCLLGMASLPGIPTKPRGLGARLGVKVSWTALVNDGGTPVDGYTVLVSDSPDGQFSEIASCSNVTSISCTARPLVAGNRYYFKVKAHNGVGWSLVSGVSASVQALWAQKPIKVSNAAKTRVLKAKQSVKLSTIGGTGSGKVSFVAIGTGCTITGAAKNQLTSKIPTNCVVTATKRGSGKYGDETSPGVRFTITR